MLDIYVRHRAVIHRARATFRHSCYDFSYVASLDPVLRDQLNQRIHGFHHRRADGILFDSGARDVVALAQVAEKLAGIAIP